MTIRIFFLILMIICGNSVLFPGDTLLQLPNNSFETLTAGGLPAQWTIESKGTVPGIRVKIDNRQAHSGEKSLQVSHDGWGKSVVVSEPLTLKVGELYRLSGWVKTGSAVTWPTDRYPTSVAACLTMESFPFTNHSPSVGATADWQKIETLFIATSGKDRVRLHLGFNGRAKGKAWFDQIRVEKVEDLRLYPDGDSQVVWSGIPL